jgi:hypothetical protein
MPVLPFLALIESEHLSQPRLQHRLCWTHDAPIEPILKVLNLHGVGDLGISDRNSDSRQSLTNLIDPRISTKGSEGLGNCFEQGFRCDFDRV